MPIWTPKYSSTHGSTLCHGTSVEDGPVFRGFLQGPVAARLKDTEGGEQLEELLSGLSLTGMGEESLRNVLAAEIPETRAWAACEALAEAYLEKEHDVVLPWHNDRDKRTPLASLPGADIIGFQSAPDGHRLALGEVKSSSAANAPPKVMSGRTGMIHQLEELASNLSVVRQIMTWLAVRVLGTGFEAAFKAAWERFLNSGNTDVALFGVLVRDRASNAKDLDSRGKAFGKCVAAPTTCHLFALYLPIPIADLPQAILQPATK